jgi:hypothetical protein
MSSLKLLEVPVESWDVILILVIFEKLDYATKREWQMSLDTTVLPTFEKFLKFLEKRCMALEALNNVQNKSGSSNSINNNNKSKGRTITHATVNKKSPLCLYCKETSHIILKCPEFQKLDANVRNNEAKQRKLCLNCLRDNHLIADCRSSSKCNICHKRHNTLLHISNNTGVNADNSDVTVNSYSIRSTTSVVNSSNLN